MLNQGLRAQIHSIIGSYFRSFAFQFGTTAFKRSTVCRHFGEPGWQTEF